MIDRKPAGEGRHRLRRLPRGHKQERQLHRLQTLPRRKERQQKSPVMTKRRAMRRQRNPQKAKRRAAGRMPKMRMPGNKGIRTAESAAYDYIKQQGE